MDACVCPWTRVHTNIYIDIVYPNICLCAYTHKHVHTHVHTLYVYKCIYTRTYLHTFVHTHYTCIDVGCNPFCAWAPQCLPGGPCVCCVCRCIWNETSSVYAGSYAYESLVYRQTCVHESVNSCVRCCKGQHAMCGLALLPALMYACKYSIPYMGV